MELDPARVADCKDWLLKARSDLEGATQLMNGNPPKRDLAVFHCQQAVEKAMKAFLRWHDRKFRKTHSLEELGESCLKIEPKLKTLVDRAVPLTEYAWKFRYPGEPADPTAEETEEALKTASDAFQEILNYLPKATRP